MGVASDDLLPNAASVSRSDWLERAARAGYGAKGVLYVLIGVFAFRSAIGWGGATMSSRDALRTIELQPFGQFLLGAVAIGLAGYALWRLFEVFADPEAGPDDGAERWLLRGYFAVSGLIYGGLAVTAFRMLAGSGGGGSGGGTEALVGDVLTHPFGRWLVFAGGLAVIGGGVYQLVRAVKASFLDKLELSAFGDTGRNVIEWTGRLGLGTRGVVFFLLGGLVIAAALQSEAQRAAGSEELMGMVASQAYGPYLLGALALGLFLYGALQLVKARHRRIPA